MAPKICFQSSALKCSKWNRTISYVPVFVCTEQDDEDEDEDLDSEVDSFVEVGVEVGFDVGELVSGVFGSSGV
jgi:hypothetical protein